MAANEAAGTAGGSTSHTLMPVETVTDEQHKALATLRQPFPDEAVEYRPAAWCRKCWKTDVCEFHTRRWCDRCQQDATEAHNCLAYVRYPYLIERLDEADPLWRWNAVAVAQSGMPLLDDSGGLWVRLTVCGMTRLGYGLPAVGGHGRKSLVEDAVRNAGKEFGMGLYLWKRGDLHPIADPEPHPAQRFVDQLNDPAVWRSVTAVTALRAEAEAAGQLDYELPLRNKTLAQVIDAQLAELERMDQKYIAARMRRDDADDLRRRAREGWKDPAELEAVLDTAVNLGLDKEPSDPTQLKGSLPLGDALRAQIHGIRQAEQATTTGATAAAAYAAGDTGQTWQHTDDARAAWQNGAAS